MASETEVSSLRERVAMRRRGSMATLDSAGTWSARVSTDAPRIPWETFLDEYMEWKQGEHVGLIGPTNSGKTSLLIHILPEQPYVVVFATKPHDSTMDYLIDHGYARMERWDSKLSPMKVPRRVLWPNAKELDSDEYQRTVFKDALNRIYRERGWCVALDEGWYFVNHLKLGHEVKKYLLQARSLKISLVFATQRPASIPLEVYDQSTHLFFWRDNDERNLERLSGISWLSANFVKYVVAQLEPHQVLYVNTRTGKMVRTRAPGPVKGGEK